jgi:hypothetical protein
MNGIDTWPEVLILAIGAIAVVLIILGCVGRFLRGGGKIRAKGVALAQPTECAPYVREHTASLARMEQTMSGMKDGIGGIMLAIDALAKTIRDIDAIQGAQISAQKITLKWIKKELGRADPGEEINGDLDEAMDKVKEAEQRYRDMRTVAGGL